MVSVFEVADWFLSKESMSHKKLQKLCYLAQAWYAVFNDGKVLFSQNIEAWIHGPIIVELYNKYVDYRWNEIPQLIPKKPIIFNDGIEETLEFVYNNYSEFSPFELEFFTLEDPAWLKAREGLRIRQEGNRIVNVNNAIDFYSQFVGYVE